MVANIESQSGEEFSLGGQIRKPAFAGQPRDQWPNYPSSAAGCTLRFSAKRRKADSAPLVQKDNSGGNVTLANGGAYTVKVVAADTTAFTKTEELYWDLALTEPSGEKTVVAEGTWEVEKSVGL